MLIGGSEVIYAFSIRAPQYTKQRVMATEREGNRSSREPITLSAMAFQTEKSTKKHT